MQLNQKQAVELVKTQNIKHIELFVQGRRFSSFPIDSNKLDSLEMATELEKCFNDYPGIDRICAKRSTSDTKEFAYTWYINEQNGAGQRNPDPIHSQTSYEQMKTELRLEMLHEKTLERLTDQISDLKEKKEPLEHLIYVGSRVMETVGFRQGWWDKAPQFNTAMQGEGSTAQALDPIDYSDHKDEPQKKQTMTKEIDFSDHHTNQKQEPGPEENKEPVHQAEVVSETQDEKLINDGVQALLEAGMTPQEIYTIGQSLKSNPGKLAMLRTFVK